MNNKFINLWVFKFYPYKDNRASNSQWILYHTVLADLSLSKANMKDILYTPLFTAKDRRENRRRKEENENIPKIKIMLKINAFQESPTSTIDIIGHLDDELIINERTCSLVNNNVLNSLLNNSTKRQIIKEADKIDAKLILMIISEKIKGKYCNIIADMNITNKEKLKYLYNILTDYFKNIVQFVLNGSLDEYLETLKRIILTRSYVENWDDSKEKDEDDDPMDINCLSKRKRTPELNKKPSNFNNNKIIKEQEKKLLNYLVNSGIYNDYNNKTTLKYIRNEDYSDNANNYDENFDFEDA
ncbi:hypothetical protein H8356DRAFT_1433173 [Neocallimastix lanati (nom. inval.)]|nr:hypothetical protein H8356DRAFT_1433173 [Neocallimastix sp. JGI-2020a]